MKTYLIHPYESVGTIEENRADEERIVQELKDLNWGTDLIRPFKMIPPTMPRRKALKLGLRLLKPCRSVMLTGDWENSEGCQKELEQAILGKKAIFEYRDNRIFFYPPEKFKKIKEDIKTDEQSTSS